MSDPRRWLDQLDPELSVERELLSAGKQLGPPPGAADRGWSGVLASLGRGPTDPSGGGGAAPGPDGSALAGGAGSSAISMVAFKAFVFGAVLGIGVMGVVQLARVSGPDELQRDGKAPPAPRSVAAAGATPPAEQQVASREPLLVNPPTPPRSTIAVPTPVARGKERPDPISQPSATAAATGAAPASSIADPPPMPPGLSAAEPVASASGASDGREGGLPGGAGPPKKVSQNSLKVEAVELAQAKNLLAAGRSAEALALLEQSGLLFAAGSLVPEREALTIEALLRNGQSQRARERARAFIGRYPNSPISERLRALAGNP